MLRRNMGIDTCVKQCIWNVYSCITSDLDSRAGSRIEKVHVTRIRDDPRLCVSLAGCDTDHLTAHTSSYGQNVTFSDLSYNSID